MRKSLFLLTLLCLITCAFACNKATGQPKAQKTISHGYCYTTVTNNSAKQDVRFVCANLNVVKNFEKIVHNLTTNFDYIEHFICVTRFTNSEAFENFTSIVLYDCKILVHLVDNCTHLLS